MKKLLLKSTLLLATLSIAGEAGAQDFIPFDMYGFMTKEDVSYNTPQAQQYVASKMMFIYDSTSPYYLQNQTSLFNSNVNIDNSWVKVTSCYVRDNVMYVVRHTDTYNQISTYDGNGNETFVMNIPTTNGNINHAAYVEDEDMVYMVFATPLGTSAALYKAPASNPADLTYVSTICNSFMEKPFSFTYCKEKDLFFYVTNSADLYSLSREGEKDRYYNIYPNNAYLPSDGSDGSESRYMDKCSGLVWSAPYNMLIWVCPRGASSGAALTYWYGLELIKGSETPVVHNLINHTNSGLTNNYYNCIITEGMAMTQGLPLAPTYVSVYSVNGKPGYYDVSWPAVKNDLDGNPIEGEVFYYVYIGDKIIAKRPQPAKGSTVGARILLPHDYTEETFCVGIETVSDAGKSTIKLSSPVKSSWDPENAGEWYEGGQGSVEMNAVVEMNVKVIGNTVTFIGLNGKSAQIYSIDGKMIANVAEDNTVVLTSGIYIVKTENKTEKIIIK